MIRISYAITACNEHVELERLLTFLNKNIRVEDEIVLQLDTTATPEVKAVVDKFNVGTRYEFHRIYYSLNKDFAAFKNNLSQHCTREYIFQIDADELLHEDFIQVLPSLLEHNPQTDVYLVPRINIVEGLTQEHITKWSWNIDLFGRVNFPDFQWRIWKNKKGIKWVNKVHERLDGYHQYTALPTTDEFCLLHIKEIERQEKQNTLYNSIQ